MKDIKSYIDSFGMITTLPGDGGDSCAHGCSIIYALMCLGATDVFKQYPQLVPLTYVSKLEKSNGRFVRHPDPAMWYSNPATFSRDQLIPLICLLGYVGHTHRLTRLFVAHLKLLLMFAWNTLPNGPTPYTQWKLPDLCGPDILGLYIRAFDWKLLYPLLFICDIPTLIGAIIYRLDLNSSTLQMNQVIVTDFSTQVMSTPVSWLAKKIYGKATPIAALNASWGPGWQPPVDTYLIPMINEKW